jgi:hypothetical protein
LHRPVGEGRGYATVVDRSSHGVRFEAAVMLDRDRFGSESLERPALVPLDDGAWRLVVSCATPGTKHSRVKDPVVKVWRGRWRMRAPMMEKSGNLTPMTCLAERLE